MHHCFVLDSDRSAAIDTLSAGGWHSLQPVAAPHHLPKKSVICRKTPSRSLSPEIELIGFAQAMNEHEPNPSVAVEERKADGGKVRSERASVAPRDGPTSVYCKRPI